MSNVIYHDFNVKKNQNSNENKGIKQDPLANLSLPGSWHSLPNTIWLVTHCMMDTKTRLFSYICRMTIGFLSKKTKVFRLAMPWPGHGEVAKLIGVNSKNNLATARKQLERAKVILVWREPGTRKEWVAVNPALFHLSPISARYVSENCGRIDFKEGSEEEIREEIKKEIESKNLGAEESKILESELLNLRVSTLESYTLDSRILYSDLAGLLYTFPDDSKVPEPVEALNKIIKIKMLKLSERTSASQKKDKGQTEGKGQHNTPQTLPASQAEPACPTEGKNLSAPRESLDGAEAELVEHLIDAHKKHCKSQGRWLKPGYKPQINEKDKIQGFPKAAKSLLTSLSGLKLYLKGLADRYAEFVVDEGAQRGWADPPNGANYSDSILIDEFFRTDEIILKAQRSERHKAEALRGQRFEAQLEQEEKEIKRKEKEEKERIEEVFDKGERPCFGQWLKYKKDLCKECKVKTEQKWYDCRQEYARKKSNSKKI